MSISGSIAARGLKFWLQVALSAVFATPWTEIRKSGSGSGKSGFSGIFFFAFSLLWTSWDLRVTPRMVRNHLIWIQTGKSGFSKIRIFRFFDFLSLKTLQYGCLMTPLDQPKSLVPGMSSTKCFLLIALFNCPLNKFWGL